MTSSQLNQDFPLDLCGAYDYYSEKNYLPSGDPLVKICEHELDHPEHCQRLSHESLGPGRIRSWIQKEKDNNKDCICPKIVAHRVNSYFSSIDNQGSLYFQISQCSKSSNVPKFLLLEKS